MTTLAVVCPGCGDLIDLSHEPVVEAIVAMHYIRANGCFECWAGVFDVPERVPAEWAA